MSTLMRETQHKTPPDPGVLAAGIRRTVVGDVIATVIGAVIGVGIALLTGVGIATGALAGSAGGLVLSGLLRPLFDYPSSRS